MIIDDSKKFRDNVKKKLSMILNNDSYGNNLERGIYNKTIQDANEKHIIKKWTNMYFVLLYINIFKMIYINLKHNNVLSLIINKKIKPLSNDVFFFVISFFPNVNKATYSKLKFKNVHLSTQFTHPDHFR